MVSERPEAISNVVFPVAETFFNVPFPPSVVEARATVALELELM